MLYFDTETCGLHGPIVLLQYAVDKDDIKLYCPWDHTVAEVCEVIEYFVYHPKGVCGFNLAFDWFHMCQMYTTLQAMLKKLGAEYFYDKPLINSIDEYALCEPLGRNGPCLKPMTALDIMLHARKGPYQSTMNRNDIRIKRVPTPLAWLLAEELDKRIKFSDVYFARFADSTRRWQVIDIEDEIDFKDIVLRFAPSSALKALAQDALGIDVDKIKLFSDVELSKKVYPVELGYAPFAKAVGSPGNWNGAWPEVIKLHINHWKYNKDAREYASDDVKYTRMLREHFGNPEPGDVDSVLACMVGAVRWKGYRIDAEEINTLRESALQKIQGVPGNFNSPNVCRVYLEQVLTEVEKKIIRGSTKRVILEEIAKWKDADICTACNGAGCDACDKGFKKSKKPHPASLRAQEILDFRFAKKEIEVYDKLLVASRFHASFVVIGTRSSRMAGSDQLNPQGIKRNPIVRSAFPMADNGDVLCGGDFEGYEVTLMDVAWPDEKLHQDLLSGKKIHALFGECLFPGMSYSDIIATKGLPGDQDLYDQSKRSVFGLAYGGDFNTLHDRVGIPLEQAQEGFQRWTQRYEGWATARQKIFDQFCSMRQPGGIGTKVEWHEPADYIESIFGFKRYFTLENRICKALFDIGEKPPKGWDNIKLKVVRRDRVQTVTGATRSALFACAFALQAANMRAAGNHVIQASGAEGTKGLQAAIWEIQPSGIFEWRVQPFNVHDEVLSPTQPEYVTDVKEAVFRFIEKYLRPTIPLIEMDWKVGLKSWADK